MAVDGTIKNKILETIPQQRPFRFIDDIIELDEKHIVGTYCFRKDEYFYAGHFPDRPVTPGVILIETMAQTGVVAFGLYLLSQEGISFSDMQQMITLFAMVDDVEFSGIVDPGEKVYIRGEKVYFRRGNLKAKTSIYRENGDLICYGVLTGRGVEVNE